MNQKQAGWAYRANLRHGALASMCMMMSVVVAPNALAQGVDAGKNSKVMSDVVASQQVAHALPYGSDIEVIRSDLQRIRFAGSGRPVQDTWAVPYAGSTAAGKTSKVDNRNAKADRIFAQVRRRPGAKRPAVRPPVARPPVARPPVVRPPIAGRRPVIVRHPHGWRGAHWGAVIAGVTLGAIIATAANAPPPPPSPDLCWTWTNSARTQGYWYYCSEP